MIAAILAEPERIAADVVGTLEEADFGHATYRRAYREIRRMFTAGEPIDVITLGRRLGDSTYSDIAHAARVIPTTANYRQYVRIVKDAARIRAAYEVLPQLTEALAVGSVEDGEQAAVELCGRLNNTVQDKAVSAADGILKFCETKACKKAYIQTGFASLDRRTYIDRGDYIIVGGRPSSGKTAFTLQIALHMARTYEVVYFSLETSADKIFDRLVASYTKTPMSAIKTQTLTERHWESVARDMQPFSELKLHVVEAAGMTVAQMRAWAVRLRADVIFVDYIGLVKAPGKSLYEQVTRISNDLHVMAQQSKIAVVALSQLSRLESGKEPVLSDLRESGAIEQDADVVIMLHTKDETTRKVSVLKNKEGITGAMDFKFYGETQRFMEVERHGQVAGI